MKKILFTLLSAIALFSSCSSDNDTFVDNALDNNSIEKKYIVNFDIKSVGFEVDKAPMRDVQTNNYFTQIVVYKQSGEVYSDTLFSAKELQNLISDNSSFPYSMNLPKGNYHLAFIHQHFFSKGITATIPSNIKLKPINFYTDTYGGSGMGLIMGGDGSNFNSYYQTIDISVPNVDSATQEIILEPMWSRVDITIEDSKTFVAPSNTEVVRIDVAPSFKTYNLATKLAEVESIHDIWDQKVFMLNKMRDTDASVISYNISKTSLENNDLKLIVTFYKNPAAGFPNALISQHVIDLHTQIENGLYYKVRGKLENVAEAYKKSMSVSLAPFNKEEIGIPFK